MRNIIKKIMEGIAEALIPKRCVGCGREGVYICKDCQIFLSEVDSTYTRKRSLAPYQGAKLLDPVMSVWEYEGLMEKLIYKIKFDSRDHIIDELVEKAFERIELNLPEDTIITYVPMWPKKERYRGFNQARLIARKLGEITNKEVVNLLIKIKDNKSQVGLGPKERIENVRGVFSAVPMTEAEPLSVLLVDDVYTTGATMNECIKILKKGGVKNIWGFTLSRKMNIQNY